MARPSVLPNAAREARDRKAAAAPLIGAHRGVSEVHIDLAFRDPEGRQTPSARGLTFAAHMPAYFQFSCPMRDCTGGGFDANTDLLPALKRKRNGHSGKVTCTGNRPRGGKKLAPCDIEASYTLEIRATEEA